MGNAVVDGGYLLLIGMPAVIQDQINRSNSFEEIVPEARI
jgi:hypothetical protein